MKWQESNRDKHIKSTAKWRIKKSDVHNAYQGKRRASKLNATPLWANLDDLKVEYQLAKWCTEVTGTLYHVDHIIPLKGNGVCGLHVPWNLQVIPAEVNLKKGIKYV